MFLKPICMHCNKNVAIIKLVRIINGKITELNLCKECGGKISPYQKKLNEAQANLSEILQKLLSSSAEKQLKDQEGAAKVKIDAVCEHCGLPFEAYRKSLFLGCGACYESFEKYLVSDLRRLHGNTQHVGKIPLRFREKLQHLRRINQLQEELGKAIEEEDFEKAAALRDQLRTIKGEIDVR